MLLRLARFFSSMLSQFLKKLVALQLTQEKLALEAEMSVIYLRRIERGRANPTLRALDRVAAILGLELSTLLLLSEGGQKSWEELRALCDGEASPHA